MKSFLLTLSICAFLALGACSKQGWYEGFKGSARKECAKDREPCPDGPEYDQYKRERDKLK